MTAKKRPPHPDKAVKKIRDTWGMAMRVAEACNIKPQAVGQWTRVPADQVHDVATVLDMLPEEIRPDIFRKHRAR